jgi:D-3-phosphoglycerate dehydrogenase
MNKLERKNINLIIDFDSTFIKDESLEIISNFSVVNKENNSKISSITTDAMNGKINFSEALVERIKLLNANRHHIDLTIKHIKKNITPSIIENKNFFKENSKNCFIVSGGFYEIIYPITKSFGISKKNIFANEFIYNKNDNIYSINNKNPLSKDLGKLEIVKNIKGFNIAIGDGYTDYEIKKHNAAELFIQFIENINRKKINSKANYIAHSFNDVITFINKNLY